MKEYTTEEIFNELWKRIEFDANVSEELASESNELQEKIYKAVDYINNHQLVIELSSKKQIQEWFDMFYIDLLNILKGSDDDDNS